MAKYTCPMHPEAISNEPGVCPKCNMNLVSDDDTEGKPTVIMTIVIHRPPRMATYTFVQCIQMSHQINRVCVRNATWRLRRLNDHRTTNMTIHDKHAGHNPNMFKQKFWLVFALTIPTLLFSHTVQGYS